MNLTYIDDKRSLEEASKEWDIKTIGVDLECENNLHHYGAYISIIQLSDGKKQWIIDCLKIKDISPVLDMFTNKNIQKIFHDVSFDLRIIHHQYKCRPKNIFDTQIAAILLGKTDLGLGSLLHEYFKIKKEQKFQMADWTKRPIEMSMSHLQRKQALTDLPLDIPLKLCLFIKFRVISRNI